jgi:hypothetical protein
LERDVDIASVEPLRPPPNAYSDSDMLVLTNVKDLIVEFANVGADRGRLPLPGRHGVIDLALV